MFVGDKYDIDYCDLYYKHITIVNDDYIVISKWSFKLTDDARVIIYNRNRFIIQATGVNVKNILFVKLS